MPEINPAMPLNAPVGPVNGAPAPGNKLEPGLPFSAATNATWEAEALEKTHAATDKRTFHVLNGRRVTAWRICVEKKRKEWAALFGVAPGGLAVLPPDCKGRILEFMAPAASSSGGRLTPADLLRMKKKREAEVVDKWVDLILELLENNAAGSGWGGTDFWAGFLGEHNAGDTLAILGEDEKWWKFRPLLKKLESLGFDVHVYDPSKDDPAEEDEEEEDRTVLSVSFLEDESDSESEEQD